jgi:hypothetical protein
MSFNDLIFEMVPRSKVNAASFLLINLCANLIMVASRAEGLVKETLKVNILKTEIYRWLIGNR